MNAILDFLTNKWLIAVMSALFLIAVFRRVF